MKIKTLRLIRTATMGAVAACCMLLTFRAAAADEQRGQLSARDYKFVVDAAKGGMAEVTLGQLAAQKATDPSVKDFAQRMVQDHQKVNDELTKLAAQKGATLPADTASAEKSTTEHLN